MLCLVRVSFIEVYRGVAARSAPDKCERARERYFALTSEMREMRATRSLTLGVSDFLPDIIIDSYNIHRTAKLVRYDWGSTTVPLHAIQETEVVQTTRYIICRYLQRFSSSHLNVGIFFFLLKLDLIIFDFLTSSSINEKKGEKVSNQMLLVTIVFSIYWL